METVAKKNTEDLIEVYNNEMSGIESEQARHNFKKELFDHATIILIIMSLVSHFMLNIEVLYILPFIVAAAITFTLFLKARKQEQVVKYHKALLKALFNKNYGK